MPAFGFMSIIPPLLAIVLALVTRNVYIALFSGCFSAYTIIAGGNPLTGIIETLNSFVKVFASSSNTIVILSIVMIGGLIQLINKSGGIQGFVNYTVHKKAIIKDRKGAQLFSWIAGVSIFTSGTLHCLVSGTIARPLSDAFKVSHEKLAYIIHTTSTPVCVLLPLSGWGAYMIGLLQSQGVADPTAAMVQSIPLNFYSLIAVLSVPLLIISGKDFGSMKTAEERAMTTGMLDRPQANGAAEAAAVQSAAYQEQKSSSALNMVLPLLALIFMILFSLYVTGKGSLLRGSGMQALLWGCSFSIFVTGAMYLAQRLMSFQEFLNNFFTGAGNLLSVAAILVFAFSLGDVVKQLGAGGYLAQLFKNILTPGLLPVLIFIISCLIAFATGTSMGTMAVMSPIGIPLAIAVGANIPLVFAALVGGSIFGDHASPISDTTVLSCSTSGCDLMDHVTTQLPYALASAALAVVFYLVAGFVM